MRVNHCHCSLALLYLPWSIASKSYTIIYPFDLREQLSELISY